MTEFEEVAQAAREEYRPERQASLSALALALATREGLAEIAAATGHGGVKEGDVVLVRQLGRFPSDRVGYARRMGTTFYIEVTERLWSDL